MCIKTKQVRTMERPTTKSRLTKRRTKPKTSPILRTLYVNHCRVGAYAGMFTRCGSFPFRFGLTCQISRIGCLVSRFTKKLRGVRRSEGQGRPVGTLSRPPIWPRACTDRTNLGNLCVFRRSISENAVNDPVVLFFSLIPQLTRPCKCRN